MGLCRLKSSACATMAFPSSVAKACFADTARDGQRHRASRDRKVLHRVPTRQAQDNWLVHPARPQLPNSRKLDAHWASCVLEKGRTGARDLPISVQACAFPSHQVRKCALEVLRAAQKKYFVVGEAHSNRDPTDRTTPVALARDRRPRLRWLFCVDRCELKQPGAATQRALS